MQLADTICYVLLTISVTTCVQAEISNPNTMEKKEKVLRKRDTTLLSSNFEAEPLYYTPNIIYKKMSRSSYRKQKPKHTSRRVRPSYSQFAHSQKHAAQRPHKNYKNALFITQKPSYNEKHKPYTSKHKHFGYKRMAPLKPTTKKPTYRYMPYQTNYKPKYREIKESKLRDFGEPNLRDFGEPKEGDYIESKFKDFGGSPRIKDFAETKIKDYSETKVNDFGEPPLGQADAAEPYMDLYRPKPTYLENIDSTIEGTTNFKAVVDPSSFDENEFKPWHPNKYDTDNSQKRFTFHKKHPVFMRDEENFNVNHIESNRYGRESNKRLPYFKFNKIVNSAWKSHDEGNKEEDIVGGRYAEPPARYVPKFMPSAPMFRGEDDFEPPLSFDDDDAPSATAVSAYVNYKNSNMAFSPQNLNDAFSVDK